MLHFYRFLIITIIFTSCRFEADIPTEPPRKKGIPADAFWIGQTDGGNWYQVGYIQPHQVSASIKIFDDETGMLIQSGYFYVICLVKKHSSIKIEDLKIQIVRLDGEKIHLRQQEGRDSCWLQKLN